MGMDIVNFCFMELILGKGVLGILGYHSFEYSLFVVGVKYRLL